jgi:hypothetical protein
MILDEPIVPLFEKKAYFVGFTAEAYRAQKNFVFWFDFQRGTSAGLSRPRHLLVITDLVE